MAGIQKNIFPALDQTVRGYWAPIFLSPILGSPEQFVIAVAAASDGGFHIEAANALNRLTHLYGSSAETALFASEVALSELKAALAERGRAALSEGTLVFSGVRIGEVRSGEASSLAELSKNWMSAISSLYKVPDLSVDAASSSEEDRSAADTLPLLVHQHVVSRHPALGQYFSEDIRNRRVRRARPAGVSIDFLGSQIVANLAMLSSSGQAKSVDLIKRKIFDLIIKRDQESQGLFPRKHEMIVFSPSSDGLITPRQMDTLKEIHDELHEQSMREEVTFVPLSEVPVIGERLAAAEFERAA